ncbi:bifunctional serine/threonine-protein kinase/formylglycine-generating enzyme family protein [uncultured Gilvimarinus sp.]|uniref:bifunctional serine/threonine-protein kinase/formylglycine-generating enzyme family protein n=1 Tax=uncultured Gilvimarinus sp. TaxID=1689143 RepID=UPI0030DC2262
MYIPGYRIIRKINHGGMSTVYLAIQESVGRVVALKVMSPALNGDPSFSERFQREANIVGQLSHPNIVSIYDIGRHENLNYIAMDYLPGGSIHDKMLSGIGADTALEILREMASALDHAHEKGYIHRDIKPENILFRDGGSAVLTDFGVALARNSGPRATHAGTVVGTPHYMSPEQTRGKHSDGRSDLYSLGIVFYEMLTGAVPYQGDEAVAIALKHLASPLPKLPTQYRRYQDILDKLLDKEPGKRYQSGRELVVDIEMLQLKMREFGDSESDNQNLSKQLQTLTQTIWWRLAAGVSAACQSVWGNVRGLRFSRQQGFYQAPHESTALGDFSTRQNTLVATRLQKTVKQPGKLQWLFAMPAQHRLLAAGAASVFLLGLVLLAWLGTNPSEPQEGIKMASAKTPSVAVATSSSAQSSQANHQPNTNPTVSDNSGTPPTERHITKAPPATTLASSLEAANNDPRVMLPAATRASSAVSSTSSSTMTSSLSSASLSHQGADGHSEPDTQSSSRSADDEPQIAEDDSEATSGSAAKFSLTVTPEPQDARIRIMNIRAKYTPGIALKPGRYHIEVTAPGYRKYLHWVTLGEQPLTKTVNLIEQRAVGSIFSSTLASGGKGPAMVVVPAGRFSMGGPDANSQPTRTVTINQRFAVSQHEVTFSEYERFAKHKGMPLPGDNRWGRGDRPVINISWEEADMYAKWLSEQSDMHYRLPSEAEWEYVAKSGKKRDYPWGNEVKNASGNANCRRDCDSDFTGFFSGKTAPVGSFKANDFGIYDMAGNVSEWVADCYSDSYQGASNKADAHDQANCPARVIRGGSLKSDAAETTTYTRQFQPQHTYHEDVGIRLVTDL